MAARGGGAAVAEGLPTRVRSGRARRLLVHLVCVSLLVLAACSDTSFKSVESDPAPAEKLLTVDPEAIDFGAVAPGAPVAHAVELLASGSSPVTISRLSIVGSAAYALTWAEGDVTLQPGESREVVVTYTPQTTNDLGRVAVESDATEPYQEVELSGGGLLPALVADPSVVYLATTFPGEVSSVVTLTSVGAVDLVIDSMIVQGEAFTADGTFPVTLPPGASTEVTVTYTPLVDGESVSGALWFTDNTPVGYAMVPLEGNVPTDEEVPPAGEPIYLNDGTELHSFDPAEGVSAYVGEFYNPTGSTPPITDIAISPTGVLYACSWSTLFEVDPGDATLTEVQALEGAANGLTFLPDGRLVTAGAGVWVLDLAAGTAVNIVAEGQYASAGDVIGLPDGYVYWTVTDSHGLVRIDPESGATELVGSLGVEGVWGLGFADDVTYGFTNGGLALLIEPTTAEVTGSVALGQGWWGATTNPVLW